MIVIYNEFKEMLHNCTFWNVLKIIGLNFNK